MSDNQVKHAIDASLSCLSVTDRQLQIIFSSVREGKKVKKKLAVSVVLALVLLLFMVTAFAVSALTGLIFLDRGQDGAPSSCTLQNNTLYYMTNRGLFSWSSTQQDPTTLLSDQELLVHGISTNTKLFYGDDLMLLDQSVQKIWAYREGKPQLILDYAGTPLAGIQMRFENLVCQNSALYVRAIEDGQAEEDAVLLRISLLDGSFQQYAVSGVLELISYRQGELLAIQRVPRQEDAVIVIEAQSGVIQERLASLPILGIEGIAYDQKSNDIYAMANGCLSVWNGTQWLPIRAYAIPERSFFFGITDDGYIAVSLAGIQFIAFNGENGAQNLSIRGFMPIHNQDHDFELTHPGFTVTRRTESHYCAQEIRQSIQEGDTTDLFLVKLDADILKMMQEGLLAPISSQALSSENAAMMPLVAQACSMDGTLYAVPSDVFVNPWMINASEDYPQTMEALLSACTLWDSEANGKDGKLFLANAYSSLPWSKQDYATYLLKQFLMEQPREPVDFATAPFMQTLKALKEATLSEAEGQSSLITANMGLSLAGFEGAETSSQQWMPPPVISPGNQPHIPLRLHVYLLNPNSQHRDAAIGYLEYISSRRSAETTALLCPEAAQATLHPAVQEWVDEIVAEQRNLGTTSGAVIDEKSLDDRVDAILADPTSWAVTEDALESYRTQVVPDLDLTLQPSLVDQTAWHIQTFTAMQAAMQTYLEGGTTLEECVAWLNEIAQGTSDSKYHNYSVVVYQKGCAKSPGIFLP